MKGIFIGAVFALLCPQVWAVPPHPGELPQDVMDLRDPFKRVIPLGPAERIKSELETVPTEDFKMVAVVTGLPHLEAILTAPSGKSYFVSEGKRIGVKDGYIRKITSTAVLVREKVVNAIGQEEILNTEIKLAEESKTAKDTGLTW